MPLWKVIKLNSQILHPLFIIFFNLDLIILILCVLTVLPAWMSVYHVHAQCHQRPEEYILLPIYMSQEWISVYQGWQHLYLLSQLTSPEVQFSYETLATSYSFIRSFTHFRAKFYSVDDLKIIICLPQFSQVQNHIAKLYSHLLKSIRLHYRNPSFFPLLSITPTHKIVPFVLKQGLCVQLMLALNCIYIQAGHELVMILLCQIPSTD